MTNKKQNWSAPQKKGIKSIDTSAILFKPTKFANPYLRSASYRNRKSVAIKGTNSECY